MLTEGRSRRRPFRGYVVAAVFALAFYGLAVLIAYELWRAL